MGDIKYRGNPFTWENNRDNKGYIKERLDYFFGSIAWLDQYNEAKMKHIFRAASDHHLILLDSKPDWQKARARFIFDSRWHDFPK